MYNTSFFKKILLIATVAVFYSCDKDFNTVGEDLIGNNDNFDLEAQHYTVTAYNKKVTPVASNNLPINALGIYENPVFGTTTASFNTQVNLASYAPALGFGAVIDSVTLNIPYFIDATKTTTSTAGKRTYVLDSIYGPETGIFKLSVYESGILLNNYNANNYDISKFYNTDRNGDFQTQATTNPNVFGLRLNNSTNTAENDQFFFSSKPIIEKTAATTTTAESSKIIDPEMRLHLDKDFFKAKIFDAPASKLASPDVFKNYFKGLYFKVEKSGTSAGRMAMMNFNKGKITVFYKAKTAEKDTEAVAKTFVINLTGDSNTNINTVNLLEESNPVSDYTTATADDVTPDEKLYLKGGQGSMVVIELFDKTDLVHYVNGEPVTGANGVSDELDEIRNNVTYKKWLANEANLVFTIDSQKMASLIGNDPETIATEPGRIYLYDLTNNTVVADYTADRTPSVNGDPKKNRTIFNGMINLDPTSKRGTTYKIRITNHIRNLIKNADVANVKLGLVVTESIDITSSSKLDKTKVLPKLNNESFLTEIPTASVMSPLGTVLFGSNIPESDEANYAKRVKLQIYYTKLKPN
ncbi:DUF4270 domain-containing protein [Flavobacterium hibisci]|uniref:DUF4270 domain-containing protein n=1 Tax=Flavobacterium hibisci TaxID=1914462 RepID=UPI001CC1A755|nr:DUF4270 domain-containing protein [Flavobacterium hibisci]MBZ4043322.1 DUF4270 domain-containing protein [Flavobacterium hibisci]